MYAYVCIGMYILDFFLLLNMMDELSTEDAPPYTLPSTTLPTKYIKYSIMYGSLIKEKDNIV